MKVAIGCDHAALNYKAAIIKHLQSKGTEYEDFGTFDSSSVDYPDYALKVSEVVAAGKCDRGILICGTGIGMSMSANKVKGVRCAHCTDTFSARATREHNNANVLALGERITGLGLALDIVDAFLNTDFTHEARHQKRIDKMSSIEEKYFK